MSVRRTVAQARPVESRLRVVLEAGIAGKKQPLHKAADVSVTRFKDTYNNTVVLIPPESWELYMAYAFIRNLMDRASERAGEAGTEAAQRVADELQEAWYDTRQKLYWALESPGFTPEDFIHTSAHSSYGFAISRRHNVYTFSNLNEGEMDRLEAEFFEGRMSYQDATKAFVEYAKSTAPRN